MPYASAVFLDPVEVQRRRFRAGLTQVELGELAGISGAQICKIEQGKHGPTPSTMRKLAAALGCTIEDLERKPAAVAS